MDLRVSLASFLLLGLAAPACIINSDDGDDDGASSVTMSADDGSGSADDGSGPGDDGGSGSGSADDGSADTTPAD